MSVTFRAIRRTTHLGGLLCLLLASACSPSVTVGDPSAPPNGSPTTDPSDPEFIPEGKVHPQSFVNSARHGLDLKKGTQDCRTCHGATLEGGSMAGAVSCDSCHKAGWREDCSYCHGQEGDESGVPPRNLDGSEDVASAPFQPHTAHLVEGAMAVSGVCTDCHIVPDDVMSPDHVFDATPGHADVTFAAAVGGGGGAFNAGSCINVYCHTDGTGNGISLVSHTAGAMACSGCHGDKNSNSLSSEHTRHMQEADVTCETCHRTVSDQNQVIVNRTLHIDGAFSVAFFDAESITSSNNGRNCSGLCHSENHGNERW